MSTPKLTPALNADYEHARKLAIDAIEIPDGEKFLLDFLSDDRLLDLATVLIYNCEELRFIEEFTVTYLWKRTGGKSRGSVTLGKCIKTAGLIHYFARTDFVIWFAADHILTAFHRRRAVQLDALMYHELRHIDRDDNGQPSSQGHEFEGFASEIERFGIWREDMKPIACAFQESLFQEETGKVTQ